ncbi:SpoIIE family protein phosphatase [Streptomyces erythrochromogenes]|uniref:SpoIIE family protein phosphatase n=1 Tax=Streptomyces erythrochromogenes TaxID=285574 RepID=UPI003637E1F1
MRLRRGRVEEIVPDVGLPFDVHPQAAYRVQRLDLQPGDRLVMLADGMPERRAVEVDLPALLVRTADLHPREASRALVAEVFQAHGGRLQDDATVMCLDWHGTRRAARRADAGAGLSEASEPEETPAPASPTTRR